MYILHLAVHVLMPYVLNLLIDYVIDDNNLATQMTLKFIHSP